MCKIQNYAKKQLRANLDNRINGCLVISQILSIISKKYFNSRLTVHTVKLKNEQDETR